MVGKGNLAVFESSGNSKTKIATPTKIGVHAFVINPYLHKFLSQFRSIKFFNDHEYSPWSEREIWPFLRVVVSPKPK